MGLPSLREHLVKEWGATIIEPLEADDVLGIWATDKAFHAGERKIIVSSDKDMRTLPCELWNPNKPEVGIEKITRASANKYHLFQTLVGDATDGYAGCPTIGPTRAARILDASPTWEAVVDAYQQQGLTEQDALKQARLAKILRVSDYNAEKGKVKYWKPKTS